MPQSEYLSKKLEMKLGAQFKKVYSQLSSDVPDMKKAMTVTTPLKYMFYELYQECIASSVRTDGTADIYPAVLRYINDHYAESINIANIAEALNYSTSYIRYIFSKKSTKTIGKYINSVRLNHAANLLKFTERTITEIAFESGFHNSNYFSTAFKKYYGLSPCQYRIKFQKNV